MPKNLIDTNIFLRLLLEDDAALLREAKSKVYSQPAASCLLTSSVLAEIIYVMAGMDFSRKQVAVAVIDLIQQEPFSYDEPWLKACLDVYAETRLDYVDCYLIARAISTGDALQTLDKQAYKRYQSLSAR
jgi:predicted nucleic-acid-binding protein